MDDEYDWMPASFDGREWWRQAAAAFELVVIAVGEEEIAGHWMWCVRRMDGTNDRRTATGVANTLQDAKAAADTSWNDRRL